ncbi:MAG: NifU family protein [Leadbetterella sp.]|nr:NifU family protein [Leadbetterella sp.]
MEDLTLKVEQALDNIRPYLIADGGNVKVLEITGDNVVKLEFIGSCGSCPMSSMTFKAGLEEAILKNVPEIKSVEAVNVAVDSY